MFARIYRGAIGSKCHPSSSKARIGSNSMFPLCFWSQRLQGVSDQFLTSKVLNSYMKVPPFKMESLKTIVSVVESGDWMVSIDLADAIFMSP